MTNPSPSVREEAKRLLKRGFHVTDLGVADVLRGLLAELEAEREKHDEEAYNDMPTCLIKIDTRWPATLRCAQCGFLYRRDFDGEIVEDAQ